MTSVRGFVEIMERDISSYERWAKPVVDRLVAGVIVLLLLPVLVTIAVLVRLSLGRDVIYRQERVGHRGRCFVIYKFRTMQPDRRVRSRPGFRGGADRRRTHKTAADPRHTRLGRFLRRYSLDELPQLWNVLKGDLSLVGPRPELVEVVDRHYDGWQHARHQVKPGLTGLWQVTQRDDDGEMHRHVDVDLRYIEHLSARMDAAIMLMTVPILFHVSAPDLFGLRALGIRRPPRAHEEALAPAYATTRDDSAMSA